MTKLVKVVAAYFSTVSTPALLYSCVLFIVVFATAQNLGTAWLWLQVFMVLFFAGLFGLIVLLRSELNLLFIRIQGSTATKLGIAILAMSIISWFLYYLSLYI